MFDNATRPYQFAPSGHRCSRWWDDRGRPREIQQGEGCEQGDALALALYAFSILPTGRASAVGDGGGVKPEVATSSCAEAASPVDLPIVGSRLATQTA